MLFAKNSSLLGQRLLASQARCLPKIFSARLGQQLKVSQAHFLPNVSAGSFHTASLLFDQKLTTSSVSKQKEHVIASPFFHRKLTTSSSSAKEHLVVALGGNALLRRGEEMTMENQLANITEGVESLKSILSQCKAVVHGNGPQAGLLILESAAYEKTTGLKMIPLDVIDAESEGMIGYQIEVALSSHIAPERGMATLLSQILVDKNDPAFQNPTKFVGPIMTKTEAEQSGLPVKPDGEHYRRVVPSPLPMKLLDHEMRALKLMTDAGCVVICAGGGGIPVVQDDATGKLVGVEAVIDKDRSAAMIGADLKADGLLILTDVAAVATDYKKPQQKFIRSVSPRKLESLMSHFPDGSMGPKCASAIDFVQRSGGWAAIGSLKEAQEIVAGSAGTRIENREGQEDFIEYYYEEDPENFPNAA